MKKVFNKNNEHNGFDVCDGVQIHSHVHDETAFYLTIRNLDIHGVKIGQKTDTEEQLIKAVRDRIQAKVKLALHYSNKVVQENPELIN